MRNALFDHESRRTPVIQRVLEPELAADEDEAWLYHEMDHRAVNSAFVDDLVAAGPVGPTVVDLGCGPLAILVEVCRRDAAVQAMGLDLDVAMLDIARRELEVAGMLGRISLQQADLKSMDWFDAEMANTVISNSVAHHLPDPAVMIATAIRIASPGGRVFIRDLYRPDTESDVEALIKLHADGEPPQAQQILRQSLHAALRVDETRAILATMNVPADAVQVTSDRHWTIDWTKPS